MFLESPGWCPDSSTQCKFWEIKSEHPGRMNPYTYSFYRKNALTIQYLLYQKSISLFYVWCPFGYLMRYYHVQNFYSWDKWILCSFPGKYRSDLPLNNTRREEKAIQEGRNPSFLFVCDTKKNGATAIKGRVAVSASELQQYRRNQKSLQRRRSPWGSDYSNFFYLSPFNYFLK